MPRMARNLVLVVVAIALSGCIGAVDRSEFDAEVRRRGGGVTTDWIIESFDSVAVSVAGTSASDLVLMSFNVNTANRTVTAVARRVDRPDFVDVVIVRQGDVVSTSPMQDADDLPLDDLTVPFTALPMDRIESLTDRALEEFGEVDGFASGILLQADAAGHYVTVKLESARQTADALFALDGTFRELER